MKMLGDVISALNSAGSGPLMNELEMEASVDPSKPTLDAKPDDADTENRRLSRCALMVSHPLKLEGEVDTWQRIEGIVNQIEY